MFSPCGKGDASSLLHISSAHGARARTGEVMSRLGCISASALAWFGVTRQHPSGSKPPGRMKGFKPPREGSGGGVEGRVPSTTTISTPAPPRGALTTLSFGVRWPHRNKFSPWLGRLMWFHLLLLLAAVLSAQQHPGSKAAPAPGEARGDDRGSPLVSSFILVTLTTPAERDSL